MAKVEVTDASETNAAQRARKNGPHSKATHADGSKQSEASQHKPALKGKSGLDGAIKNKY
jgi:hypothetical protein